jgi:hypothetical protein
MTRTERAAIVAALRRAFGAARDVSLNQEQPLIVLLGRLHLPAPWTSPGKAMVRYADWPTNRPEFFIDPEVRNEKGEPPRSNNEVALLGRTWRQFSFSFPWDGSEPDPVKAVELWLTRFRLAE